MTDCFELPRVHALVDGELGAREVALVRAHLAGCARCRSEYAFLMQLAIAVARGVTSIDEAEASGTFGALVAIAAIRRPS